MAISKKYVTGNKHDDDIENIPVTGKKAILGYSNLELRNYPGPSPFLSVDIGMVIEKIQASKDFEIHHNTFALTPF